jgi:hypothetical protein
MTSALRYSTLLQPHHLWIDCSVVIDCHAEPVAICLQVHSFTPSHALLSPLICFRCVLQTPPGCEAVSYTWPCIPLVLSDKPCYSGRASASLAVFCAHVLVSDFSPPSTPSSCESAAPSAVMSGLVKKLDAVFSTSHTPHRRASAVATAASAPEAAATSASPALLHVSPHHHVVDTGNSFPVCARTPHLDRISCRAQTRAQAARGVAHVAVR